ncbi:zinc ribbon domain-containing protein [Faecalibacterium sp. An77]|uniref:zinc ribbon domain-containing protein n=1 Tax=Faecalibacterium sp. An77 TaxID=1965655 RepID=UPI001186BA0D|nr:zinc ribbon domain-containing protein [Faecalibacterium sp. An77]
MALIVCPECSSYVSEKAELCPHCGYPIAESIKSKKAEEQQLIRTEKKKNIKKRKIAFWFVLISAVIVIGIGIACLIQNSLEKKQLYDGIKWGTDIDTIKERYPNGGEVEPSDAETTSAYLSVFDSLVGMDKLSGIAIYYFNEDGLYQITIAATTNEEDSENELSQQVINYYKNLYGKPEEDSTSNYMVWKKSKSKIEINTYENSAILIVYQDAKYQ